MSEQTLNRWQALSKKQAFLIHLALSILVFGTLVAIMMTLWFPGKLFFLDGGWQGLKIVALIDIVLGPALTLLLYAPGKPKLLLDMSLIALFQLSALAYGFYATYTQRTVAVVYADRNFITLSADSAEIAKQELLERNKEISSIADLDDRLPAMLVTPEPSPNEFGKYTSELLSGYPELHERLDLFEKRETKHADMLSARAVTMDRLSVTGADAIVKKALDNINHDKDDIEFHHFKARYAKGVVLFSKREQEILDYVAIPWNELISKKEAELADSDSTENKSENSAPQAENENETTSRSEVAESVEQ